MMKVYPEYRESREKWIGDIPKHWVETRFKFLLSQKNKTSNMDLPCGAISFGNVVYKDAEKLTEETRLAYQEVLAGEFLVNPLNLNYDLKSLRTALSDKDVIVSSGYIVLNSNAKTVSEYLRWLLFVFDIRHMKTLGAGIRQTITAKDIGDCFTYLPPLKEQECIAQFLEVETLRVDNLIAEKESFINLLQEKRQALISHVVTKGLDDNLKMKPSGVEWIGDIPEHWEVKPIKYLGVLGPSKSELSHDFLSRQCSFVPMEKLKTDTILLDEERVVQDVVDGYTYFANGDILFAKVTPCFENKNMCIADGLTNGVGFGSSEINVFRTNKSNEKKFVYYLLQEEYFMQFAKSNMTGTGGLKRVPSDVVLDYKVAVPPLKEQIEIAEEISNRFARLALLIEETKNSIELLKEHRTALISAAVTGKIDVREAV